MAGREIAFAERLDQVAGDARLARPLHQLLLAVGAEQEHRRDAFLGEDARRFDAVHVRHFDIHNDNVRAHLARQVDSTAAVAHLAGHQIAEVGQHLAQIHSYQ
jgi:hypothetical protein